MTIKITESNFVLLAIKAYCVIRCEGIDDILQDVDRFGLVNKLFFRYIKGDGLNHRLILNHLVILFNVFGEDTIRFLFYKIKPEYYQAMMPFLACLSRLDEFVEIDNILVPVSKIGYDEFVATMLKEI